MHVFRFQVDFKEQLLTSDSEGSKVVLCSGAFAECSGLEATMEPKVIKEGGRNWGANQRAGKVTFATLILKRGMTTTKDLWTWYEFVGTGKYAHRLNAVITMFDNSGKAVLGWKLTRALPIKFKAADLNAKGTDVAVEELHLAHEGLSMVGSKELTGNLN
ncbi:MAG: phage tail protein [Gammaproteobacteria bacterium SG8_11]|nr:MAG: phage tail protein [Gammaproteobacteria bacterium SG8_11]